MNRKKSVTKHIPNFITSLNLACGVLSIVMLVEGKIIPAFYLVLLAAVFDFLDGLAARLFNAYSDVGKQLDSLADMVSFGIAPTLFMFYYLSCSFILKQSGFVLETNALNEIIIQYSAILIAVASGFRLAKFNIDPDQSFSFSGLPTPANAIFIASAGLVIFSPDIPEKIRHFLLNPYLLFTLTLVLSFLLISKIPMFSLKFKNYKIENNITRYAFLFISVVLLIVLKVNAIPVIVIVYILISVIWWVFGKGHYSP